MPKAQVESIIYFNQGISFYGYALANTFNIFNCSFKAQLKLLYQLAVNAILFVNLD